MKHWKLFEVGDKVIITHSHTKEDIGKKGVIVERRNSFCRIDIGKLKNFTYAQFKKDESMC